MLPTATLQLNVRQIGLVNRRKIAPFWRSTPAIHTLETILGLDIGSSGALKRMMGRGVRLNVIGRRRQIRINATQPTLVRVRSLRYVLQPSVNTHLHKRTHCLNNTQQRFNKGANIKGLFVFHRHLK